MLRLRRAMKRNPNTPPMRNPPAPPPADLIGPMNDERVRELQRVIAEKRAAAIAELGDRWLLHPRNRIR